MHTSMLHMHENAWKWSFVIATPRGKPTVERKPRTPYVQQQTQRKRDYGKSHKNILQCGCVQMPHTSKSDSQQLQRVAPLKLPTHSAAVEQQRTLYVSLHPSMLCSGRATRWCCVRHVCFNLISVGGCKFDKKVDTPSTFYTKTAEWNISDMMR